MPLTASRPTIAHSGGCPKVEHQQPEDTLADHHGEVGRDDHPLRPEPVREDAAKQREHQHRRGLRGEHVGQVGRRPGDLEHRERDPDHRETDGERREQPVGQQEPEITDGEHSVPAAKRTPKHDRVRS